jgi:hypothetical protein
VGEPWSRNERRAPCAGLAERSGTAPFVGAAQHAFEFEDQDDLDFAGFDLAHECADARTVHRTARVGRVGEAGDFKPAVVGVLRDEIATDGGLAFAGVEATANLVGSGDAE